MMSQGRILSILAKSQLDKNNIIPYCDNTKTFQPTRMKRKIKYFNLQNKARSRNNCGGINENCCLYHSSFKSRAHTFELRIFKVIYR